MYTPFNILIPLQAWSWHTAAHPAPCREALWDCSGSHREWVAYLEQLSWSGSEVFGSSTIKVIEISTVEYHVKMTRPKSVILATWIIISLYLVEFRCLDLLHL